jgi:hypothetical protein
VLSVLPLGFEWKRKNNEHNFKTSNKVQMHDIRNKTSPIDTGQKVVFRKEEFTDELRRRVGGRRRGIS